MTREIRPWRKRWGALNPLRRDDSDNPFLALHRDLDQLFEDFFGSWETGPAWPGSKDLRNAANAWAVNVDLSENDKEVRIVADVPGMDEKDMTVELTGNMLTIRGERKTERNEKQDDYHLTERTVGHFHRAIPLPDGLLEEQARARFKNGVLTVTIPKSPEAKRPRKQIAITGE